MLSQQSLVVPNYDARKHGRITQTTSHPLDDLVDFSDHQEFLDFSKQSFSNPLYLQTTTGIRLVAFCRTRADGSIQSVVSMGTIQVETLGIFWLYLREPNHLPLESLSRTRKSDFCRGISYRCGYAIWRVAHWQGKQRLVPIGIICESCCCFFLRFRSVPRIGLNFGGHRGKGIRLNTACRSHGVKPKTSNGK